MKQIKVIFIAVEIASLIAVVTMAFSSVPPNAEFFKAAYISLFSLLAVVMQKEQQDIEWEDEENV